MVALLFFVFLLLLFLPSVLWFFLDPAYIFGDFYCFFLVFFFLVFLCTFCICFVVLGSTMTPAYGPTSIASHQER